MVWFYATYDKIFVLFYLSYYIYLHHCWPWCFLPFSVSNHEACSNADVSDMSSDPPSPTSTDPSPERCIREPVIRPRPQPLPVHHFSPIPSAHSHTRGGSILPPMSYSPMSPTMFAHAPMSFAQAYHQSPMAMTSYNYQTAMTSPSLPPMSTGGRLAPSPVSPLQAQSYKHPEMMPMRPGGGHSPPSMCHVKPEHPQTSPNYPHSAPSWPAPAHPVSLFKQFIFLLNITRSVEHFRK